MRLEASLSGKLTEYLEKELKNAEIAVTRGVSLATNQLKESMRTQVKSAGFPQSILWFAWSFGSGKKRIFARAKWHFGDGRSYCAGCNQDGKIFCPFHKCRYTETSLKTVEGYQAWEILLKLSKPDLSLALSLAQNLGLDMEIMSELLPVGLFAILDNQKNECS